MSTPRSGNQGGLLYKPGRLNVNQGDLRTLEKSRFCVVMSTNEYLLQTEPHVNDIHFIMQCIYYIKNKAYIHFSTIILENNHK